MSDRTLLRRLRRSDPAALEELIGLYGSYAYAIAYNIMGRAMSAEDVEEVVADAFVGLWEHRKNIETELLKAYLAAIVRNKAKSALRRNRLTEPLEDDVLELSLSDDPERIALSAELRQITRQAVGALPEPDREIFQRHYFLYQTTEEIARDMGMNSATVRTRLARGRKRLRQALEERGICCADPDF